MREEESYLSILSAGKELKRKMLVNFYIKFLMESNIYTILEFAIEIWNLKIYWWMILTTSKYLILDLVLHLMTNKVFLLLVEVLVMPLLKWLLDKNTMDKLRICGVVVWLFTLWSVDFYLLKIQKQTNFIKRF